MSEDISEKEEDKLARDVMTTEIVVGKAYRCPAIKIAKGKKPGRPG